MEKPTDFGERLLACEQEPIHIPGAVQPFGVLICVEEPGLKIRNVSVNSGEALGIEAVKLTGRSFAELVVADQLHALQQFLARDNLREQTPLRLTLHLPAAAPCEQWELNAHRNAGCLVLELEPACADESDAVSFQRKIRDAVQALQSAGSLQQLCEAAVAQMRSMTGFDRVMLYQFNEEWHGKVIAESCAPHMDSYLDHHFPASDIPAQARAVFLQNWLRMIPDVDYSPAALHPETNHLNGAPLDLGHALLRSVSPIHLEYLRNMQVKATLTISLVDEGKLWGLIACHHALPRKIDADSRLGAKMIGQLVSSQIQLKQSLDDLHYRGQLRAIHARLLSTMEQEEDLVQGLVDCTPGMLDLAGASGAAAAVHHDDDWTIVGRTPSVAQIDRLVDWLVQQHGREEMFCTNRLGKHFPPAEEYKEVASGLVAISIPKSPRNYILWFRPQVATTVLWAGNPEKPLVKDGDHARLHPRGSFKSWREIVEGVAAPWKKVETEAIAELRGSILALGLQREFKKEQEARARAVRLSREKENMVHMMSHDLRTPLGTVKMSLEMLQQLKDLSPEMAQTVLARGLRATDAIERLAKGVLDLAKVEAGTPARTQVPVDAGELVRNSVDLAIPLAEKKSVQLHAQLRAENKPVLCERSRIEQVLGNLISNALKFTPEGGSVTVSVEQDRDRLVFCVADTGMGIAAEHLDSIFERFWQEEHAREQGTGLGLSIAKGIVEQEGGRIWARSTPGRGSSFFFDLPCVRDGAGAGP